MLTKEQRDELRLEVARYTVEREQYPAAAMLPLLDALDEMERERDSIRENSQHGWSVRDEAFVALERRRAADLEAFDRTVAGERENSKSLCNALYYIEGLARGAPEEEAIRSVIHEAIRKLAPPSDNGIALARMERERDEVKEKWHRDNALIHGLHVEGLGIAAARDEWKARAEKAEAHMQMEWRARLGNRVLALFADIATATEMTRGMDDSGLLVERI